MNRAELLALIAARSAADPAIAALVAARTYDAAGSLLVFLEPHLPARPKTYLITLRGLRRVLGAREGRVFVQALREAAAAGAALPEAHPAHDDLWWLGELLPDLESGGGGIDVGDSATRAALRTLAAIGPSLGTPHQVAAAHCDALDAASSELDRPSLDDVYQAIQE